MSAARLLLRALALVLLLVASACSRPSSDAAASFPPAPAPADNAPTAARFELGKKLFYDTRLSRTREVSCASCHEQAAAFSDPRPASVGVLGRKGTRNAPALVNLAWSTSYFWDGGVKTLEQQVVGPITNPLEMDMTVGEVVRRVAADADYAKLVRQAYGGESRPEVITKALAVFLRGLVSNTSPYDRYLQGDRSALSPSAKRGLELAMGERGECFHCHVGFNFTNNQVANNGVPTSDPGRQKITGNDDDLGKFKVPTLRNVALSAPYMHDGSLATLRDVVDHYVAGGKHANTDPTIQPLELDEADKADLVAFLESLTDRAFVENPRFAPKR